MDYNRSNDWQWQNSPMFSPTQPYSAFQVADPCFNNRPNYAKSYSLERLNQPVYLVRSPGPSPVHTPTGSPVIGRRASPSPRPPRRAPLPPLPKVPSGKPPLPRRPVLMKSKTVDEDSLPRPLDSTSKIPSLDSLYEQLKVLSGSTTPPVSQAIIDDQLAADLTAVALEMVANSPLLRRRSSTFSGPSAPFSNFPRPKV